MPVHTEWLKFLREVDREAPRDKALHLIADNYATHRHPAVQEWLARHPRFGMHFTPTSASWLNMVERFFGDLTTERLNLGVFASVPALEAAFCKYVAHHNTNPKLFICQGRPRHPAERHPRRLALNFKKAERNGALECGLWTPTLAAPTSAMTPLDRPRSSSSRRLHRHCVTCRPSPSRTFRWRPAALPNCRWTRWRRSRFEAARGGYCDERNSLLQAALTELGFAVTGLSARVRGHTLLHVELPEGRFLVDASVGGLPLAAPVMMDRLDAQPTPHEPVRLMPNGSDRLLQAHIGDEWVDVYRFDLAPHLPTDLVQKTWHRDPPELAVQQPPRS